MISSVYAPVLQRIPKMERSAFRIVLDPFVLEFKVTKCDLKEGQLGNWKSQFVMSKNGIPEKKIFEGYFGI